jgi:hypothetical protein
MTPGAANEVCSLKTALLGGAIMEIIITNPQNRNADKLLKVLNTVKMPFHSRYMCFPMCSNLRITKLNAVSTPLITLTC